MCCSCVRSSSTAATGSTGSPSASHTSWTSGGSVAAASAATTCARWSRCSPAIHPYTHEGLEVEVRAHDCWVELLECGLAAPEVLTRAGLPPEHTGLAMGIG